MTDRVTVDMNKNDGAVGCLLIIIILGFIWWLASPSMPEEGLVPTGFEKRITSLEERVAKLEEYLDINYNEKKDDQ